VRAQREEMLEELEGVGGKSVDRVRTHLRQTVEVVALELGLSQLEDMGVVIAGQIAEYVASVADGVIRDPNDEWWAIEDHVPVRLVGSQEGG
jgi:hypothetical protein